MSLSQDGRHSCLAQRCAASSGIAAVVAGRRCRRGHGSRPVTTHTPGENGQGDVRQGRAQRTRSGGQHAKGDNSQNTLPGGGGVGVGQGHASSETAVRVNGYAKDVLCLSIDWCGVFIHQSAVGAHARSRQQHDHSKRMQETRPGATPGCTPGFTPGFRLTALAASSMPPMVSFPRRPLCPVRGRPIWALWRQPK